MRRQPARLLTLVGLLLVSCGRERSSIAINLYATALRALRDSIAVYDSTPSILVQAEPVLVKEGAGMSAPADSPEFFEPGRLDGLVQFVDTATGWSLCPAPAGACIKGRPAHVLAVSRPTLVDSAGGVTIWATYARLYPHAGFEWSYYKVTLHRTKNGWRADPAVFIGAEP